MAFIIQTHGRLHEWVADEKGYFTDEGLDYEFRTLMPARWSCEKTTDEAPEEVKSGAFESMEAGRPVSISSAAIGPRTWLPQPDMVSYGPRHMP